jgi:dTDP-4-amino-4,6-dideoxygalactose transaminase
VQCAHDVGVKLSGLKVLPPVRHAVSLRRTDSVRGRSTFLGAFKHYNVHPVDSGTTALALALLDARQRHPSTRPEAIVPAYGCPQLVAACLFASVRPRLVDTARDGWGYDKQSLDGALTRDTVAVLAVNLLGIGDEAAAIGSLARAAGALCIQDSAQHLPGAGEMSWSGDYVVLSFGRGKPLNLLRGGALAVPVERPLIARRLREGSRLRDAVMGSRAAAVAFNLATHPFFYGMTSRLPGLGVGTTRYDPLEQATTLPDSAWGQMGPAFMEYSRETQRAPWAGVAKECERLGFPMLRCASEPLESNGRRLRMALLAGSVGRRDAVVRALNQQGLGASEMYGTSLDCIDGIPAEVASQGPFPNAKALAEQLFTLPTHSSVTADTVARTLECLRSVA